MISCCVPFSRITPNPWPEASEPIAGISCAPSSAKAAENAAAPSVDSLAEFDDSLEVTTKVIEEYKACEKKDYLQWGEDDKNDDMNFDM